MVDIWQQPSDDLILSLETIWVLYNMAPTASLNSNLVMEKGSRGIKGWF